MVRNAKKIGANVSSIIKGNKTVKEVAKSVIPFSKYSLVDRISSVKSKRNYLYYLSMVLIGYGSYEYHRHLDLVPITNRRHFVSLPREFELSYQQEMINYIRSFYTTEEDEETVCTILDDDDSRVCHVKSLIKSIAEACVYFSPECESYMNNLEVLVVDDDDDLNAYVTMGSVLVVSSGLLRYYENLQSQGKIANSDECVACILAHELAHMLSRHPVESMLRWTSIAYHVYITMVPDLVLMPCIKSVFDRWISREQEHEADFQALYLLKRAGYDPAKLLETLAMLPEGTMYRDVLSKTRELVDNHPSVPKRIEFLRSRMDAFEQDFKERYQVKERHVEQRPSFAKFLLSFAGLY